MSTPATTPAPGKPMGLIPGLYRRFQLLSARLESPFLLLVRVYWGWQFAQSGWGRLHNLDRATGFFASLNIPAPHLTVICISLLEFVGGLMLIGGLATRFWGLLLAGDMVVAYLTADRAAVSSIISNPGQFYGADPYTFLFASLMALIFGAGRYSVDYLLWRRHGGGC
ncbi:MAG TPA: DoxX family protein [Acidobacteriaceae bacterium]